MRHPAAIRAPQIRRTPRILLALVAVATAIPLAALCLVISPARGQCPEQGPFQYYSGAGQVGCPCFVAGEQAGVTFTLPPENYPIEITRIGIGWASQYGGAPAQIEQAIHVYAGGLPNPGSPIFSLEGPLLTDGAINEFNLDPLPGEIRIESGPFTVALEFMNDNAGNPFSPSVYSDGTACQPGKNLVYAIPGGWYDACSLGVSGDWVMYVKYRSLKVTAAGSPNPVVFSNIPVNQTTCDTLTVGNTGCDTLAISGISGCGAAPFSLDTTLTSLSIPPGGHTTLRICVTPTSSEPANCAITVASNATDGPTIFDVSIEGVTGVQDNATPSRFAILGIVPNPFNPMTRVRFALPQAGRARVSIHDGRGRLVRQLLDEDLSAGIHEVVWDGRDARNLAASSGIYFARLQMGGEARVARMSLIR
jgi:hypothetical protein